MFICPFFQGQSKDVSDIDIMPTLTTLKTWYPYLTIKNYSFIIDTIDIKLYKPEQTKQKTSISNYTCAVKLDNKALQLIGLPLIFNTLEVVFQLTDKLKNNGNNPTITYQLGRTTRTKILNYKILSVYLC